MIDIEERLKQHLSQQARGATPRADLAGVTSAPTVVTLRRDGRSQLRTRRRAIALAAVVVVVVAAAIAVNEQRSIAPASTEWGAGDMDDPSCIVFMDPQAGEQEIIAVGDALRRRPEVVDLGLVTQEEAYAEFRRLFADKPDIVDFATTHELPASWRLALDPDTEAVHASIDDEIGRQPAVKNVTCRSR